MTGKWPEGHQSGFQTVVIRINMIFISLIKFRNKAKDVVDTGNKVLKNPPKGVKVISTYWTLGRFDSVWIYEAPSEKEAMKLGMAIGEVASSQTMVAVPREQALALLD